MKGLSRTLAIALEAVGIMVVVSGITVEVIMKADIGYILITSGAGIVAIGGLYFAKVIRRK